MTSGKRNHQKQPLRVPKNIKKSASKSVKQVKEFRFPEKRRHHSRVWTTQSQGNVAFLIIYHFCCRPVSIATCPSRLVCEGYPENNLIYVLTLPAPCISESCIKKNYLKFFHTSLWCLKRMKAFKAFIKPFEAPQRSVKIKI